MDRFDGTMSKVYPPSSRERLVVICKRFIAQELRKNGFEVGDEGVMLVEGPSEDRETYQRLKSGEIEYPTTAANLLARLVGVWAVKGRHREKPDQLVELLVAEYRTLQDLAPLGRLDGDRWVSPLVEK